MKLLKQDFKPGQTATSVPASWFNAVANFLNNLVGLNGISVIRSSDPPQIRLDVQKVKEAMELSAVCPNAAATGETDADVAARAPEAVESYKASETDAEKIQRIGTSAVAARADHVHRLPETLTLRDDALNVKCRNVAADGWETVFHCKDSSGVDKAYIQMSTAGELKIISHTVGDTWNVLEISNVGIKISNGGQTGEIEILNRSGADEIKVPGALQITAPGKVFLSTAPSATDAINTTEVPTIGWVNNYFVKKGGNPNVINVVTDVTWDGTQLVKSTSTLTFTGGILTNRVDNQPTVIDNAVTYN